MADTRQKEWTRAEYRFRMSPVEKLLLDKVLEMENLTVSTWARNHIREDALQEGLSWLEVPETSEGSE